VSVVIFGSSGTIRPEGAPNSLREKRLDEGVDNAAVKPPI
jgi:hypothetical protein